MTPPRPFAVRIALPLALAGAACAVIAPTAIGGGGERYTLAASPGVGAFGSVEVGTSAALEFSITGAPLPTFVWAVGAVAGPTLPFDAPPARLFGADAAEFSTDPTVPNACVAGVDALAGPCVVRVLFSPTRAGQKAADLTVVATPIQGANATSDPCGYASGARGEAAPEVLPCTVTVPLTGTAIAAAAPPTAAPVAAVPQIGAALTPRVSRTRVGGLVRVTVIASNPGATTLANVVTRLTIPSGFAVVRTGDGVRSGRTVSWTAPSLTAAASASYSVTLRALRSSARIAGVRVVTTANGASASAGARIVVQRAKPRVPVTG